MKMMTGSMETPSRDWIFSSKQNLTFLPSSGCVFYFFPRKPASVAHHLARYQFLLANATLLFIATLLRSDPGSYSATKQHGLSYSGPVIFFCFCFLFSAMSSLVS